MDNMCNHYMIILYILNHWLAAASLSLSAFIFALTVSQSTYMSLPYVLNFSMSSSFEYCYKNLFL